MEIVVLVVSKVDLELDVVVVSCCGLDFGLTRKLVDVEPVAV